MILPPHVIELSEVFTGIIIQWLTSEEIKEVNRKNAITGDSSCATHEYCDPNEAMYQAFKSVKGREINYEDGEDIELMNRAWAMSKKQQFKN